MKVSILALITSSVICCGVSASHGEEAPRREELPLRISTGTTPDEPIIVYRKVYLNETLPQLGARLYDKVDYELSLRKLTKDIRIAEAELGVQRERLRVYDKYFGNTSALFVTRQNARLDILKSEEQLKLLRREKLLSLRYRNDQVRYRELLLGESAIRLNVDPRTGS